MKKMFTLFLVVCMLIIGSTTTVFANRGHRGGNHYAPPPPPPPQRWHHHNRHYGPPIGYLIGAVVADAIVLAQQNNAPCEEVVYQPPCNNGPVPIASGNIPFGSGQYVQVASGQYADVVFRNGTQQRFFGPRRIFDVSWYALYNQ